MFLRFVSLTRVSGLRSRQGFFAAAYELMEAEAGHRSAEQIASVLTWYRNNMAVPPRFSRSKSKGHYRRETTAGLSWFKPSANEHLAKAYELAALLQENGRPIEILKTSQPGYLIYEDAHQLVAEPFNDNHLLR